MEEGDNVYWERVHNSGGSLVVRQVKRLRWALGGLARIEMSFSLDILPLTSTHCFLSDK